MHQMLREIIRAVVCAEPDLMIIGEFPDQEAALASIDAGNPAVAINSREETRERDLSYLLRRHPQLRVLSVSADGSETFLCELRPHEQILGELSPKAFVAVIRGVC